MAVGIMGAQCRKQSLGSISVPVRAAIAIHRFRELLELQPRPADEKSLNAMLDQVVAWSAAPKPLGERSG